MLADPPALDPALAAWPAEVRAELARRRQQVVEAVSRIPGTRDRVLDLSDAADRRVVLHDGAANDTYDTVISIAGFVHFADLGAALASIERLLAPGGELWFVEPVARPGWQGMLGSSVGALLPPLRDLHLGRDIPHAVRSTGLLITDIKRFSMPTSLWPLRPFVHARAMAFPGVVS